MLRLLFVVLLVSFLGCASTAKKMNKLKLGMSEDEVTDTIGEPDSAKAAAGKKVLVYKFCEPERDGTACFSRSGEYWVILVKDKVTQFGRAGDFGSSEPQTNKLIIENQ